MKTAFLPIFLCMRIVVIGNSPLIFLSHLGLARELLAIFYIDYVPRAVRKA